MLEFGDVITLENNMEYVVSGVCDFLDNKYLYLVNSKEVSDCIVAMYDEENNEVNVVEDPDLFDKVMPKFIDSLNEDFLESGEEDEWYS